MGNKRYYWLKLKEDFFEEDAISWLEEQPNGKEYSLFYLKLCLKSLKTNGTLIRTVGNMLVPYDAKKLAEITKTDFDTALVAMELLKKIGLIEILDGGEIYLTHLHEMVGSETNKAVSMRKMRARKALEEGEGNNVTPMLPECSESVPLDIDKDKELEKEQDIEQETEEEKKKNADARESISTTDLDSEFENLWKLYPRKEGKSNAQRDYIKARKDKKNPVTMEMVEDGIRRYLAYIKANGVEKRFVKQGSTWFHQKCWEDEYLTEGSGRNGTATDDCATPRFGNYV